MTGKYTKGPWRIKPNGVVVGGAAIERPGGNIQQQIALICSIDDGDRDANARLIAAAPDLLAALQALAEIVLMQFGHPPEGADGPLPQALAAISKAIDAEDARC